jgi:hypothetical protein
MVIELTAASDFNKFINVNFHNHTDLGRVSVSATRQSQQAALSLPGFQRITIRRCYSELFTHGIAPEPFHNALRQMACSPDVSGTV